MKRSVLFALSSVVCNTSVDAFGPRIEPASSFHGSSSTAIKATASSEHDDEDDCGVMALEQTYSIHPSEVVVLDSLFGQGGKHILLEEPFVMDDILFTGLLEQYEALAIDDDALSCGEDCEDCLIPDEFKHFPDDKPFDVMSYLGIKRAQPVQAALDTAFQ